MSDMAARAALRAPVPSVKAPREALWRLSVEASECSEALPRILGIVGGHALVPASIDYARTAAGMNLDIVVAGLDERTAWLVEGRVARLVSVAKVSLAEALPPPS